LYVTGDNWDHYLLFAMTEINSGMYRSTMGDITFQYKLLYADPESSMVEGETQAVFSSNYESCHLFVGPAYTPQLSSIGEWAGVLQKPIVSGGVTSPIFAQDNFGYVSRSTPSDIYVMEAFIQFMVKYEWSIINIVYFNDEYGRSGAESLVELSNGRFEVQALRTFYSVDDIEGINSVLNDLEASPTHVTYLSMTILQMEDFLNAAGRRKMHENHLWLAPYALDVADKLDPPSTGGIWGVNWGEELTEANPFAQRYLAKDPTPHIEAQQYGLEDDYDDLTYWGAYAYDAVLASAYALAAAENRSDGEQVLKEIRSLSLNNTNTGILQMDEKGDRIGARIPIFYITPDGNTEQFAVYYNGTTDYLREPLWPGGSTTQPDLIEQDAIAKR
jgi:ABC-type branched-subunit amino acid transport system substrate-binding protein